MGHQGLSRCGQRALQQGCTALWKEPPFWGMCCYQLCKVASTEGTCQQRRVHVWQVSHGWASAGLRAPTSRPGSLPPVPLPQGRPGTPAQHPYVVGAFDRSLSQLQALE